MFSSRKSAAPAAAGGYTIAKSLRFRSSASAYLNRTPASAGNRQKWTWSGWVKRGSLSSSQSMFDAYTAGSTYGILQFLINSDILQWYDVSGGSATMHLETTQVFRDPSAWYHLVFAYDSTQATSSNRAKLYVNGVQITSFSTTSYPAQNTNSNINNNIAHDIGRFGGGSNYLDGYLAEVNFIDGQALTPTSFGATNAATGVWQPIAYTGTYGTNGFYLKFTDTTSTSTLGNDSSGNNNTWTVNNISLTSGSTYDSMKDVPTLTDADTANYAVLNPVQSAGNGYTLSNGNLNWSWTGGPGSFWQRATLSVSSGKWYWEVTPTAVDAGPNLYIGIQTPDTTSSSGTSENIGNGYAYYSLGTKLTGTTVSSYGASWTNNDVISVALDMDAGTLTFYKNNASQGTAFSGITGSMSPVIMSFTGGTRTTSGFVNFGQRPFAYTPPTGFVALNTFNLPTPTIGATASTQANKYFDISLYTGTGATQSITGLGFQPDFTWIKKRNSTSFSSHQLVDAVRGTSAYLFTDSTNAEATATDRLTAFNSNGFTLSTASQVNGNTDTFVAWNWDANGAGSSNTQGSITSTVSANTTAGFSIVTYTGTGANATVGHGLGVAPKWVIVKGRNVGSTNWFIYTETQGATKYLDFSTGTGGTDTSAWNSTAPTSTVFSVGTSYYTNYSATTYVAYCWAQVAGYSAFGSYTGNGSSDGPFIYTGFRPKYILTKKTNASGTQWNIWDSVRNTYNVAGSNLWADSSEAETTSDASYGVDILSNGFKLRNSSSGRNASGDTYIYAAFAESPFKYANAR